ncbi:MAG: PIG-L family deacetylase, partial [Burkholderiales bacterium]|nr:PIG-L family deacetylase [Burkholderiales bacterium]
YSSEPAEEAIHQLCGTSVSSGVPYRFTIHYSGPIAGQNIRIDATSIDSNNTPRTAAINGSNEFGLPVLDPEAVIAASSKILMLTAHEDDEIWFSPVVGKYCGAAGKTCRVVATTSNRTYHPDANEFVNAMAFLPAVSDIGTFYSGPGSDSPQTVLNQWSTQAAQWGLVDLNNVVRMEIDKFAPDVILTFDPRHGTSCHPEHRAVGQAVIAGVKAYSGTNFNKANLFLLESRRLDIDNYSASIAAVPKDRHSVAYDMMNYMPAKGMTGFDFFINMMEKYPTQFNADAIQRVLKADKSDMVVSLLPIGHYVENDSRYSTSPPDARVSVCPAFSPAPIPTPTPAPVPVPTPTAAPSCAPTSLNPSSVPASGGMVYAQANCTGGGLSYTWSVNGVTYPGNLATNSSPVGVNSTTSPNFYAICVKAQNASGEATNCVQLVQAASVPIAPVCSSVSLSTYSLPTSGGNVAASANCSHSGSGMFYTWFVNGAPYPAPGPQSVTYQPSNSALVGANLTASPVGYTVCVVANDSNGQSAQACSAQLVQARAASVLPSAPTIGSATASNGVIYVSFTPGALGTGAFVKYTANCGHGPVNGNGSPIAMTGLDSGFYMCKVKTTSTAGDSEWSDYASPVQL